MMDDNESAGPPIAARNTGTGAISEGAKMDARTEALRSTAIKPPRVEALRDGGAKIEVTEEQNNNIGGAFGSLSPDFINERLRQILNRLRSSDDATRATEFNAALALISGVSPRNELEATVACQMADIDGLLTDCMARAGRTNDLDHRDRYINQATKLQRTFVAQVEALAKLRSGGKQQVEVRYVYVNGNAVIGDVHTGGERGQAIRNAHQPHAPGLLGVPFAPGSPVFGADAQGIGLSGAGDEISGAVPDAWREESRCAERLSERELPTRAANGRGADVAPPRRRSRAVRP